MKITYHRIILATTLSLLITPLHAAQQTCPSSGLCLQVLGSGGPEVQDKRASSSYLIWQNGSPRILIDSGGGSALRFGQSGANVTDLYAVLFTHFHIDHSSDFPALIKSSYFEDRNKDLPVFGPEGNKLLPSADQFIQRLFNDKSGTWPYMSDFLPAISQVKDTGEYHLSARDIPFNREKAVKVFSKNGLSVSTISVHHGPLLALAWRIDADGKSIVISGDMNGDYHSLEKLAKDADLLVAHNAVPENTRGVARNLHMPPSVIGKIAQSANVKQLVLSHLMLRTLNKRQQTLKFIQQHYRGKTRFANDLDIFIP